MKVVLFCGGLGMRLREFSESIPKPMINLGYRPILWHLMRYYAHFGHKDFILCLGYRGDIVKNYFLNYDECLSNDFILSEGGKKRELLYSDIDEWRITFVDTGLHSNVGQRLKAVEHHLEGQEVFFANYSDGLTSLPLPEYLDYFLQRQKIAAFACVKPNQTFHVVSTTGDLVNEIKYISQADIWVNGGFFIFRNDIFRYVKDSEELIEEPFRRLVAERQLLAYKYTGFWGAMDTFKDREMLEDMCVRGDAPWEVWRGPKG